MSNQTINVTDEIYRYILDVSLREPPILAELRRRTADHPRMTMQISPEQGQLMALLVRLCWCPQMSGDRRVYRLQQPRRGAGSAG